MESIGLNPMSYDHDVEQFPEITFRPVEESDRDFLMQVYASTREEEFAGMPWTPEEKRDFLEYQFNEQDQIFRQHYPDAEFEVILYHGEAIGRFYWERQADEIRVVDIALLPSHRNLGIGSSILLSLLDEARATHSRVTVQVEHFNPAHRCFQRLGFVGIGSKGIYMEMLWKAEPTFRSRETLRVSESQATPMVSLAI